MAAAVAADLAALPLPPWGLGTDAHQTHLELEVRHVLSTHAPKDKAAPKARRIQAEAWALMDARRRTARPRRTIDLLARRAVLLPVLAAWLVAARGAAPPLTGAGGRFAHAPSSIDALAAAPGAEATAWQALLPLAVQAELLLEIPAVAKRRRLAKRLSRVSLSGTGLFQRAAWRLRAAAGEGAVPCKKPWASAPALYVVQAVSFLAHKATGAALKVLLARDRAVAAVERALQVSTSFAEGKAKDGHQGLRRLRAACPGSKKSSAQGLPMLVDDDGKALPTMAATRRHLQRFFGQQEAAEYMQALELAEKHCKRLAARQGRGRPGRPHAITAAIEDILPLRATERLFAEAARGKAAGFGGIPVDVFALFAPQMARIFHPLFVKMALRLAEPLALKGGGGDCTSWPSGTAPRPRPKATAAS